jgi:hypothetical protein
VAVARPSHFKIFWIRTQALRLLRGGGWGEDPRLRPPKELYFEKNWTQFGCPIMPGPRGSQVNGVSGLLFRTEGLTSEGFIIQMDEIIELHIFPSLPEGANLRQHQRWRSETALI